MCHRETIQRDPIRADVLDFCKMFGKFVIYSPRYINAKTFGLSAGHPRCSEFAPRLGRLGRRILVQLPKHPVPTRAASAVLAFRDPATAVRTIKEVVTAAFGSPLNRRQSQPHDVGDGFAPRLPPDPPGRQAVEWAVPGSTSATPLGRRGSCPRADGFPTRDATGRIRKRICVVCGPGDHVTQATRGPGNREGRLCQGWAGNEYRPLRGVTGGGASGPAHHPMVQQFPAGVYVRRVCVIGMVGSMI